MRYPEVVRACGPGLAEELGYPQDRKEWEEEWQDEGEKSGMNDMGVGRLDQNSGILYEGVWSATREYG